MRYVVWLLVVLLIILHQDFWNWHRHEPLLFGFVPIGLSWHVGISLMAALVAWLATCYCWPTDIVDSVESSQPADRDH